MAKSDRKLEWKIGSVIIIIVLTLITWGVISLFWTGSSKEIQLVADQLQTPSSWKLIHDRVEGPRNWCGDLVCPSVNRQWETEHIVSKEELITILNKSQWNLPIDGTCLPVKDTFGDHIKLCSAKGRIGKYRVSVNVSASNPPNKSWVGLNVEEYR